MIMIMTIILILSGSFLIYLWIGTKYGFISPHSFYPFEWNFKEGVLILYKDESKKHSLKFCDRRSYSIRIKLKNPKGVGYIIRDAVILYRNTGFGSLGGYPPYSFCNLVGKTYYSSSRYSYVILDSISNEYIDPETIISINPRFNDNDRVPLIFNNRTI